MKAGQEWNEQSARALVDARFTTTAPFAIEGLLTVVIDKGATGRVVGIQQSPRPLQGNPGPRNGLRSFFETERAWDIVVAFDGFPYRASVPRWRWDELFQPHAHHDTPGVGA